MNTTISPAFPADSDLYYDFNISSLEYDFPSFSLDALIEEMKESTYGYKKPLTIVLMLLYSAVFILGLLGNIFVMATVFHYKHMRTLTNVLLVNLTVGDLLVVLFCIPITLGSYVYTDFVFGTAMCKITPFLQGSAISVSSLSLLSISINRYIAIHTPLRAKIIFSRKRIQILLVHVWVLSFSAFIPLLFVNNVQKRGIPGIFEKRVCEEMWTSPRAKQVYNIVMFTLLFLLPLVVMTIAYARVGMTLWGDDSKVLTQPGRITRQRRRTVKMLIYVVLLFCVSWLPYNVVNIWLDFNINSSSSVYIYNNIYPIIQLLGISNSAINPVCYCFMSKGFRRSFLKLCCRRKLGKSKNTFFMMKFKYSEDSQGNSVDTALTRSWHHDHHML